MFNLACGAVLLGAYTRFVNSAVAEARSAGSVAMATAFRLDPFPYPLTAVPSERAGTIAVLVVGSGLSDANTATGATGREANPSLRGVKGLPEGAGGRRGRGVDTHARRKEGDTRGSAVEVTESARTEGTEVAAITVTGTEEAARTEAAAAAAGGEEATWGREAKPSLRTGTTERQHGEGDCVRVCRGGIQ